MNLLIILFVLLMIWYICKGYKRGIAKEIRGLVSLLMALIVLSVVFLLIASIIQKNMKTAVIAVVLLLVVSILYRFINMIMKSIETLAKLPIIGLVNRLLGAGAGIAKLFIIFWIMYVIVDCFPTGPVGEQIMTWTNQNTILINIYNKNYIAHWIMSISGI